MAKILTIIVDPEGWGSVSTSPAGDYVSPGKRSFPDNTVVTLRDLSAYIFMLFDHWEGDLSGRDYIQTLTMNKDKTVKAVYSNLLAEIPDPTKGTVYGLAYDSVTGQVIPSVNVYAGTKVGKSYDWGFYGIANLSPGYYTILFKKTGYLDYQWMGNVPAGTWPLNVYLDPAPVGEPASVSGTVIDSFGSSLTNATIAVSGKSVITGSNGRYSIADLMAGSHTFTVSRPGYNTRTDTILLFPGANTINFTLTPEEVEPPPPTYASLSGTVKNKNTGIAIAGALVKLDSSYSITDGSGKYTIAKLTPGSYQITVSMQGYDTLTSTITISAGANSLDILLNITLANVSGVVKSTTGTPIDNAIVTIGAASVSTGVGNDGKYAISGLVPGTYTASAEAEGYQTATDTVQLKAGSNEVIFILPPVDVPAPDKPSISDFKISDFARL